MIKSIRMSIAVFLTIFIATNIIYALTHYALGSVAIPEWYIKENPNYLSEPILVRPIVDYWFERGLTFSYIYGGISFILTFYFSFKFKNKFSENKDLSKDYLS